MICCTCHEFMRDRGVPYCKPCAKYLADPEADKMSKALKNVDIRLVRPDDEDWKEITKGLPRLTNMVKTYNNTVMAAWAGDEQIL